MQLSSRLERLCTSSMAATDGATRSSQLTDNLMNMDEASTTLAVGETGSKRADTGSQVGVLVTWLVIWLLELYVLVSSKVMPGWVLNELSSHCSLLIILSAWRRRDTYTLFKSLV